MLLALSFIVAKCAVLYAKPFFLIALRMLLAGGFLLLHQLYYQKTAIFKKMLHYKKEFFVMAFFHIYCAFAFEFWALQYLTALKTVLIYSATPFITALIAYIVLQERLSYHKISGMLIASLGFLPLFSSMTEQSPFCKLLSPELVSYSLGALTIPDFVLSLAVLSGAYGWFCVKRVMHKGFSYVFANGAAMFIGGILCLISSLLFEGCYEPLIFSWGHFLGWLSLLILLSNVIFYNLYGYLMGKYSMTFISLCGFLCPLFSTLFEWLLLDGVIMWQHIFCLIVVTLGLTVFHAGSLRE